MIKITFPYKFLLLLLYFVGVGYITNPIEVQHRYCYYHRIKDLLDKKEGPLRGDLIEGNQQ